MQCTPDIRLNVPPVDQRGDIRRHFPSHPPTTPRLLIRHNPNGNSHRQIHRGEPTHSP
ncbi:hypothetical protein BDV38DRAFT_5401 [Aspergillus pseudotamarii]|uniref:Uncharacterized protein n=1 Tax=Aspergillus pseudotamarii TaxID=132259 RepID=A0A5N6TCF3_ASPPS|nr:uncharacterized protein BDV38DRAFT_5401 [Aspergillus pseudotamarii]KAE8143950.1 hypothetical protein BDV38DRAFT_5401 [Aspergillus pseudotamarii]